MAEKFVFLDTTIISSLSKEVVSYNGTALNSLYTPSSQIIITSTIYDEATLHHELYPDAEARKAWLDEGIATGKIIRIATPGFPAGISNAGEMSIVDVAGREYRGKPVIIVSNDRFFENYDAINLVPNQRHYTGQEALVDSLFNGGISVAEYFVTSNNLALYSYEAAVFQPGQVIYGSNGVIIDATNPLSIVVTSRNGISKTLSPFDRFSIDDQGNVTKIGTFDPETEVFTPSEPVQFCFAAGTIVSTEMGGVPIEKIRVGDKVDAFSSINDILVPARVIQLHKTEAQEVINFHGVEVTPGHVFLAGDGTFKKLSDILEEDGTIVDRDGCELRARTGLPVGTVEDQVIPVGYQSDNGVDVAMMRAGTPYGSKDGETFTILEAMNERGFHLRPDGHFVNIDGKVVTAFWEWGAPTADQVAN